MTSTGKIRSEFYIEHDKFQDLSDKAMEWFVKSFKYPAGSDEYKICHLKSNLYMREALNHLKKAEKELCQN